MPLTKSSEGLEELVDESSGKEIVIAPVIVDRLDSLMKKYEQFLGLGYGGRGLVQKHMQDVVLPCDINIFLQSTLHYETHENYEQNTGLFISQLIKNSYEAGNNGFELDMNSLKPINFLVSEVYGTKERMVIVVVKGEAGNYCGCSSQYSTFTIEKAGYGCGHSAQHSTFTVEEAGYLCWYGARNSTFNTHNPEQYERFKKSVHPSKDNKLYLLSPNGSILEGGAW